MKSVVVERIAGEPQWNPRFLDFAAYYGFLPASVIPIGPRLHATTREIPIERWAQEHLLSIVGRPDYHTSYVSYRQVSKDCLLSYAGNRYSVPYRYAGKKVTVRETLDSGMIRIFHQQEGIAEHRLAQGKGAMVMEAAH